jgi:uncharacterized cupin superfamily protein
LRYETPRPCVEFTAALSNSFSKGIAMSTSESALKTKLIRNYLTHPRERFERAPLYDCESAQLTNDTAARKLGAGFDIVAPGMQACPYHFHYAQEEMFVILKGNGTLRVAGELIAISEGDVICIPSGPEYPHHILNTSDAPLHYLSISTQESPELCEYPDSAKMYAFAEKGKARLRNRAEANVDYWDGEP